MSYSSRRGWVAVALVLLCVAIGSCGGEDEITAGGELSSTEYLAELTRNRAQGLDAQYWPDDARDFVEASGERKEPFAEVVATGRVVSWNEGAAFVESEPGGAVSVEVPFDSPDALWRTIELEFEVDDVTHGRLGTDSITVGYSFGAGADPEKIAQGFMDLGELALPLFSGSAVFDYKPGIWTIVGDGLFLMTVSPSGELGLPLANPETEEALLGATSTVDSLRPSTS